MIRATIILFISMLGLSTSLFYSCKKLQDCFDTAEYSSGYSETAFQAIQLGETTDTVMRTLGLPLKITTAKWDTTKKSWRFGGDYSNSLALYIYSASTNSSHYRHRSLVLDLERGIVIRKDASFYID